MRTPEGTCPRLLLVDDDRLNAATLAPSLQACGYCVFLAYSAEEALRLLAGITVDMVILDEQLPGMTGLELAVLLSEQHGLPVIFLTAFNDPSRVRKAVECGALAYLVKPVDTEQLLPSLSAALARSEELRQLRSTRQHLQRALDERREISIAVGILMERLGIDRQPAFERLRKTARSQRRRIEDVARDLMQRPTGSPRHADR